MGRIIINYDDSINDLEAIKYVISVMMAGRISDFGKCYCYCTTFKDDTVVLAGQTRCGTDKFIVRNDILVTNVTNHCDNV